MSEKPTSAVSVESKETLTQSNKSEIKMKVDMLDVNKNHNLHADLTQTLEAESFVDKKYPLKLEDNKNNIKMEGATLDNSLELELKRRLQKEKRLEAKRIAEEKYLKERKEKAIKGMQYLLGLSEKYTNFFKDRVFSDDSNGKNLKPLQEKNRFQPTVDDMKKVKSAAKNRQGKDQNYANISKSLKYFEGGALRPYQLDGVTWMTVLYENGLNGILADEMGLGKTIQVIALICHLLEKNITGPYLIVAPLSTLPNWEAEFKRFAPQVPVVVFHGSQVERMQKYRLVRKEYGVDSMRTRPVVLTSYQVPLKEVDFLRQFEWQYLIVDEGHRIKNHESKLSTILRSLHSSNRLLLTGTPLQNNLTELWALLNFVLPQIFDNMETFSALLMVEDVQDENRLLEQEQENNLISTIHKVLAPFMLRRLKKDVIHDMVPKEEVNVYCPLTPFQRDLYSYVIDRNIAKLRRSEEEVIDWDAPRAKRKCMLKNSVYTEKEEDDIDDLIDQEEQIMDRKIEKKMVPFITRITMQNSMMMFKKIVNHPYLVHFPLDPSKEEKELLVDENLISASGKMTVLDVMLPKLKKMGHKVLIFSTLVMMLDLIEDYMMFRGINYRRLDGSHSLSDRGDNIADFNVDKDVFAFLLSTRAGGLGLNLTAADTVIFFDRDWNPQVDIQAQDRCHRIGQTKPVKVYTLITKNTIDEKIIQCGESKRLLEKIVIKDGKFKILNDTDRNKVENELLELQELLNKSNRSTDSYSLTDEKELDKLLDRSRLYEMMENQKK